MEAHMIEIVRFAVCLLAAVAGILVMVRADDNNALRRLAAVVAAVLIFFNEQISTLVYLLIGSALEALLAAMGLTFVIVLAAAVMVFPLAAIVRWVTH